MHTQKCVHKTPFSRWTYEEDIDPPLLNKQLEGLRDVPDGTTRAECVLMQGRARRCWEMA